MNITPFLIYVWQLADAIKVFLVILVSIYPAALFATSMARDVADLKPVVPRWFYRPITIIGLVFVLLLSLLIPSSRTIAMMYVLPKVQQIIPSTETMSKEASDVYAMLKDYLAKELKEK